MKSEKEIIIKLNEILTKDYPNMTAIKVLAWVLKDEKKKGFFDKL